MGDMNRAQGERLCRVLGKGKEAGFVRRSGVFSGLASDGAVITNLEVMNRGQGIKRLPLWEALPKSIKGGNDGN